MPYISPKGVISNKWILLEVTVFTVTSILQKVDDLQKTHLKLSYHTISSDKPLRYQGPFPARDPSQYWRDPLSKVFIWSNFSGVSQLIFELEFRWKWHRVLCFNTMRDFQRNLRFRSCAHGLWTLFITCLFLRNTPITLLVNNGYEPT